MPLHGSACSPSQEQHLTMLVAQVGELLLDDGFSMFEAMSAIEIGDSKLDAGLPARANPR